MTVELRLAKLELFSTGLAYVPPKELERNLGFAIFLVAVEDYCSIDDQIHEDARDFLYPLTAEWQDQFDWALSLADGLNPGWLRDALDRCRCSWDEQRAGQLARKSRRLRLRMGRKASEHTANVEHEQTAVVVRGDLVAV